ncbi:MAG TPA: sigma-70 family RNA polymerase sigma factor [Acidimicrobiales bacterium]|nr:sigma-70 family RNA polymerase sigma factor [Acidimicrobiales bacterium]
MTAQVPDLGAALPSAVGERIADALRAACHQRIVSIVGPGPLALMTRAVSLPSGSVVVDAPAIPVIDVDRLVVELFEREGRSLVRMARLFVDDRNAAEDLVQEAFIRLARSADKIKDQSKAAAYLRSIVLNLARDENRRGLVSLRHHLPFDPVRASFEDELVLRDDQRVVIDALRDLPHRQRDCLVLRYYQELGIDDIAETLGISRNSVKTHLKRGLVAMEKGVT